MACMALDGVALDAGCKGVHDGITQAARGRRLTGSETISPVVTAPRACWALWAGTRSVSHSQLAGDGSRLGCINTVFSQPSFSGFE